ncbi:MAG: glycosyltransferase family 2 protein [Blautia sp.]|nr:glycosyltransferase family 2 protein [Blautia sp.]
MSLLSVVLPAYNEEKMIKKAVAVIGDVLSKEGIHYEIVLVNDGSKDHTWEEIEEVAAHDIHVCGVHFSRNFGKESAMMAGLANAKGDCCVVMDCDLQHPPQTVVEMYRLWEQGYEVVEGIKRNRGEESAVHSFAAKTFYAIISKAVGIDMTKASDFKLMDRKAVDALLMLTEKNVFFRALSAWVGYQTTSVEFDVSERIEGESKWSSKSLIKYAITNIAAFSAFPMQFVTFAGFCTFILAVILGVQTLVRYFTGHAVEGFTTVIMISLLLGSIIMMSLGIIGFYIEKIYEEVKGRPKYLISKKIDSRIEQRL